MMNYMYPSAIGAGCGPLLQSGTTKAASLRQQFFQHVRANGRAARADVARALKISAGSATAVTSDLIAAGLLREVHEPTRETGRGRPSVALEVVPSAAYVVGIKLSSRRHSAVLSDFVGNVLAGVTLPSSNQRRTPTQLLDQMTTLIEMLAQKGEISVGNIGAVGVGLPGIVDMESGVVRWCSLLQGDDVDFAPAFAARFDMPLFIDNDTNMLTLAELWFGEGRDKTDFAVVTIENGVGMGLVVNNTLYRGSHGVGLELGHTKVQMDGALCRCGQRGCLEAYLGDYALTREVGVALDLGEMHNRTPEDLLDLLFDEAKAGNTAAATIFRRAGRYLAVGLSNVVQLFDPPLIIISGERTRYDYLFADEVLAEMKTMTLSDMRKPCAIAIRPWDDMVWAHGATVPAISALSDQFVTACETSNA
ncbi:ROK family protein [Pacificibacter marinus]|nr:ROK family protein [Pacificibacter marinus]MBU2865516.1 ROK family protein [Pacificibacter marinus]